MRPNPSLDDSEAMLANKSETTSGMTVIRIALTQSNPSGSTNPTTRRSAALCDAPMMLPAINPARRPMTTRCARTRSAFGQFRYA
jgi:hypothetical protein